MARRAVLPFISSPKEQRATGEEPGLLWPALCSPNPYVEAPESTVVTFEDRAFMEIIQFK